MMAFPRLNNVSFWILPFLPLLWIIQILLTFFTLAVPYLKLIWYITKEQPLWVLMALRFLYLMSRYFLLLHYCPDLIANSFCSLKESASECFMAVFSLLAFNPVFCDEESLNIPWSNSNSLNTGRDSLNRMFTYSESNNPALHKFIQEHCFHLLSPLVGDTGIPATMAKPSGLYDMPDLAYLGQSYTTMYTNSLRGQSGVYVFFKDGSLDQVSQCGSSTNFGSRLKSHFSRSNDLKFASDGLENFYWAPVKITPNYEYLYLNKIGKLTPEVEYIVRSFTQQEIRTYEQAYSRFAKPIYYNNQDISVSHGKWVPGLCRDQMGSLVFVLDSKGNSYEYPSVTKAAAGLGISNRTILRVCNCLEFITTESPTHGAVQIFVEGKPEQVVPDYSESVDNNLVDYTTLIPGKVYLYNSDMVQLDNGPYNTAVDAYRALGKTSASEIDKASRWVNRLTLVESALLSMSVYLVSYKLNKALPVLIYDIAKRAYTHHASIHEAAKYVGYTSASSNFAKSYIVKSSYYTNPDGKKFMTGMESEADLLQLQVRFSEQLVRQSAKYIAGSKRGKK